MSFLPPTMLLATTCLMGTSAMSQCIVESIGLPGNIEPALLGTSVSIHGDLAVIGAPLQQGEVTWAAGRLHVYRFDGQVWELEAELVAEDGAVADMLGISVDTDGDRIIAGAWFQDTVYSNDGAAYIFHKPEGLGWVLEQKIVAQSPRPEATFGRTVAIDGDVVAVGSPLDSTLGSASGRVHLFELESGIWSETTQLQAPFQQPLERFGLALDIRGTRIAVGASWADAERGAVHIFEHDGEIWGHTARIDDPNGNDGDQFGFDVALAGEWLGVGAYKADALETDCGAISFYRLNNEAWEWMSGFYGSDLGSSAQFGVSISMSEQTALVGSRFGTAPGGEPRTGVVTAFRLNRGEWNRGENLVAPKVGFEAEFGWQISVSGEKALVGAPYADEPVAETGGAYFLESLASGCDGIPGDLNGDGKVNGGDLGLLLSFFGPCPGCPADLNGDEVVNGGDLGLLLVAWSV